ncbi:GNAT family N-acetyltransferase [Streptomyces uncialis]|uniref:GNAT family N-acetyltransferase n=1 Tax=Streptomyces uncialis TaxID=1048205 RepID=UPI002E3334D3|nr:GNAT family N-acetyltransferase [Streptomyces uncialis]
MRTASEAVVEIGDHLLEDPSWNDVVERSEASIFHRSELLHAYRAYPLRTTLGMYFLGVRSTRTSRLTVALPVFLLPADDPLGVCPSLLAGFSPAGRPLLLSHNWHCYDSRLPAVDPNPGTLAAVRSALGSLARDVGAQAFGFVNVPAGDVLADLLIDVGADVQPIDARYVLDLRSMNSVEDYLARLRPRVRQEMRRHTRAMHAAGYHVTVGPPEEADMAEAARLCGLTSAKHGNPGWYDIEHLTRFGMELRAHIRLIMIRRGTEIVAASVSLLDGRRFHNWAGGTVETAELSFSPYQVMLRSTIEAAVLSGCAVLEGGRRNDGWKERFGLSRLPLLGCLTSADHIGGRGMMQQ